jgi:aconitate hydratase
MGGTGQDSFKTRQTLSVGGRGYEIFSLRALEKAGFAGVARLPVSLRILLENLLRTEDGRKTTRADIEAVAVWDPGAKPEQEIAFTPARVLLQDFTGVPAVVDLAAMRDAIARMGGDPSRINPLQPADLVIDHSVQVDRFGTPSAFEENVRIEFERNRERYEFLRWGAGSFHNFRVVPPGTGIVHQVNLEYLARVAFTREENGATFAFPDTLVGTDSHTTMINGLGVVGWGVGGIEAEAAMLGQPISMLVPQVVGFRLTGALRAGTTATDAVLTVTQMLRKKGVVGKFVEFYGPGLRSLSLADRATIANMAPEYGATIGFFPVDEETLNYLRFTGRDPDAVALVKAYYQAQGLFRTDEMPEPHFSDTLALDLGEVEPSLAGPKRPQDRIPLGESKQAFQETLADLLKASAGGGVDARVSVREDGGTFELGHGAVVIAAITSCTNTSNPSVMIAAGLLARNAVERGLSAKPWVKTSLAPGSKVVTDYLKATGLMQSLEALRFHLVGYGCTTCIGNSGPLPEPIARAVKEQNLVAAAVLSGNRNFEGRVNPLVRANYLASPPLVVAYALAGTLDIDLTREPLGTDSRGVPVMLKDLWPSPGEVAETIRKGIRSEMFNRSYGDVLRGDEIWSSLPVPAGDRYGWDAASTYIKAPPFFEAMAPKPPPPTDIRGARVLALLGDTVTTDHISPAGSIAADAPAGSYLTGRGVEPRDFNSYGSRRGNHEVMMRGTFGNIRLRNQLLPGTEGPWTLHLPGREKMFIYDAAMKYAEQGVPLVILAGAEYGTGSSRDWAAKGTRLLGVRAVLASSFERIHRSNLIGMGVLPLQFEEGEDRASHGLTGLETFDVEGIAAGLEPRGKVTVTATGEDGQAKRFTAVARVDTPNEVDYFRHGGILHYVLRSLLQKDD